MFLFITVTQVKSQNSFIEIGEKYAVVKIGLKNYQFIKVRTLVLINDSTLTYQSSGSNLQKTLPVKNVKFISERKGTYAVYYGLVGGGIGFLSALSAHVGTNFAGYNYAPWYIGLTAGGAVVGTLVGLCVPKWKSLSFKDGRTAYSFRMSPYIYGNQYGLGLTINMGHSQPEDGR
jgi:hypothetical protein